MASIRYLVVLILILFSFNFELKAEGSYELRGKSSSNNEVRIDGRSSGYNGAISFGLPRVTILYVDILDSANESIDLYTSNPNNSNTNVDIAVWCPSNKPSNPEGANAHNTANAVFDVRDRGRRNGLISSWSDVISVQSVNTRNRRPVTFDPSREGCGDGVYTVRFYSHSQSGDTFAGALNYFDIGVRNENLDSLIKGRVFSDHYSLIVDGFDKTLNFKLYAIEAEDFFDYYEGYVWEIDANNIQPFGFQLVSNNIGANPSVYNDKSISINSNPSPVLTKQYNIYLNYPDKNVRLPNQRPVAGDFNYENICPEDFDPNGYTTGGYFSFNSNAVWKYKIYIDLNKDGDISLDEKVFQGTATQGTNQIYWDGILPNGQEVEEGTEIKFNLYLSDGEVHFPWVDVENQYTNSGPLFNLVNTSTNDSRYYYWDDSLLSSNSTTSVDGTLNVHTWGNNLGNNVLMDTWKYAYNSGLQKTVLYKGNCNNPNEIGTVFGYVYNDQNQNKVKESNDQGIANVNIILEDLNNNTCEETLTDSNGYYIFENTLLSNFRVVEAANQSGTCSAVEGDPNGYISVDENIKLVNFNSQNIAQINFSDFYGYKIEGKTFIDNGLGSNQAHNGIQDGSENNFSNIKIEVLWGSNIVQSKYSKADGGFEFWIPSDYDNVILKVEDKSDYKNVSANVGNTGGSINNYQEINLNNVIGKKSGIRFGYVKDPSIFANQSTTIQAGTNTIYAHKYRINTIGTATFSIENINKVPNDNNLNINSILYHDVNCNGVIDQGIDNQNITNINVNNEEICLVVKVITPLNAPDNSTYNFDIEAETSYQNIPIVVSKSVKDITIITSSGNNSNLILVKDVDKSNALPNEIISYTVTAKNSGQDTLNSIIINDFTPNFTNFVSANCPIQLPTGITSCTIETLPNVGEKGSVRWRFDGNLNSNEELKVFYQVRVDN